MLSSIFIGWFCRLSLPDPLPICACVAAADGLIALTASLVGESAQQEPSWLRKERPTRFSPLLLSKQSREEVQFSQHPKLDLCVPLDLLRFP